MGNFYLPYHFVPAARGGRKGDLAVREFRRGKAGNLQGVRHDLYVKDAFSGTIHCEAKAASAVFVGDKRIEGQEEIAGFKLNGKPALPASSLRGMVSAIAEAASNSAMRVLGRTVLGESCYSYRKSMRKPLSAIGKLSKVGERFFVEPVCLPLLQYDAAGKLDLEEKWRDVFVKEPVLRVFVGDKDSIRRDKDESGTKKRWTARTTSVPSEKMPLRKLTWTDIESLKAAPKAALNVKNNTTLVAQNREPHQPEQEGLLRVLGCYEKGAAGEELRQIPGNKEHELFLPYVEDRFERLPIPGPVMERFQQLANQMTSQSEGEKSPRPYEPKDTRFRKTGEPLVPTAGDLVFFDLSADGKSVSEISYSSIWRHRVETSAEKGANAWSFFKEVDKEINPFTTPDRLHITAAEQIFGFSEEKDGEEVENGLRLRGRVRFSHGLADGNVIEVGLTPLKELSSPKPPSPALYFRTKAGANPHIAKSELRPNVHWPQGRKFYLHHPNAINGTAEPWRNPGTFEGKRHVKIRPWAKDSKWRFEVRFDNLSNSELGLLLYALNPSDHFRHKVGMGKPIGLGSLQVTIKRVEFVDRQNRYSSEGWSKARNMEAGPRAWEEFRNDYRNGMQSEIRTTIEELGNPAQLNPATEITYPRVIGQNDETELYKWFVSNDDPKNRRTAALQPIVVVNDRTMQPAKIQALPRLPAPKTGS